MAKINNDKNPLLFRYAPNCRFIAGAFNRQKCVDLHPVEFGESVTDKESYRLQLSGKRGAISSLQEGMQKGWYMFDDGKYDIHKDFSYIMRKDLSIVDIDRYTELLKKELESADESLASDIKSQISQLQSKKEAITENQEVPSSSAKSE